jgi:release factor glutamine methyltransferase
MTPPPVEPLKVAELDLRPATTRAAARAALALRFGARGFDDPAREAALLLAGVCPLRMVDLLVAPEAPLGEAAARVAAAARRRLAGEPLSRILGRREFWSLEFALSSDALDPRPETETIVEAALAALASRRTEPLRVLDLGVGSGALLCALLSELRAARGLGVDLSEGAAATARANVAALGFGDRAEVRVGDWATGIDGPFDLIVANPPYVRSDDIALLARETRDHDPRLALDGGADGLDAYRALAPEIARLIAPIGWFFFEVGAGQAAAVAAIAGAAGLAEIVTRRDLAGIERVVGGRGAKR